MYAIGGNPEAAVLAGINTRWTIMKTFIVMGALAAVAAVIVTARLNASTSALGTGAELQVIAAAVIGGTSFAGGIGTIAGGVLGAVDHAVTDVGHDPDRDPKLGAGHRRRDRADRRGRLRLVAAASPIVSMEAGR